MFVGRGLNPGLKDPVIRSAQNRTRSKQWKSAIAILSAEGFIRWFSRCDSFHKLGEPKIDPKYFSPCSGDPKMAPLLLGNPICLLVKGPQGYVVLYYGTCGQ